MTAGGSDASGDLFPGAAPVTAQLRTTGAALVVAVKLVKKFAGSEKKVGEALLGFDGEHLVLELGGVVHRAAAAGDWGGEARVPGAFILRLSHIAPSAEPVEFAVVGDQLSVKSGSWSYEVPCRWEVSPRPGDALPTRASHRDKVVFGLAHGPADIERLGLTSVVEAAMTRLERQVAAAAEPLVDLGVTVEDILDLVKRKLGGGRV